MIPGNARAVRARVRWHGARLGFAARRESLLRFIFRVAPDHDCKSSRRMTRCASRDSLGRVRRVGADFLGSALLYCFRDFFRETQALAFDGRSPAPRSSPRTLEDVARILEHAHEGIDHRPVASRARFPVRSVPSRGDDSRAPPSPRRPACSPAPPSSPPPSPPPPRRDAAARTVPRRSASRASSARARGDARRDAARDPRPVLAAPFDPRRRLRRRRRRSLGATTRVSRAALRLLRRPSRANGRRARARLGLLRRPSTENELVLRVDGVPTPSVRFQATPRRLRRLRRRRLLERRCLGSPPRRLRLAPRVRRDLRRPRGVVERRLRLARRRNLLRHAHPRFFVRGRLARGGGREGGKPLERAARARARRRRPFRRLRLRRRRVRRRVSRGLAPPSGARRVRRVADDVSAAARGDWVGTFGARLRREEPAAREAAADVEAVAPEDSPLERCLNGCLNAESSVAAGKFSVAVTIPRSRDPEGTAASRGSVGTSPGTSTRRTSSRGESRESRESPGDAETPADSAMSRSSSTTRFASRSTSSVARFVSASVASRAAARLAMRSASAAAWSSRRKRATCSFVNADLASRSRRRWRRLSWRLRDSDRAFARFSASPSGKGFADGGISRGTSVFGSTPARRQEMTERGSRERDAELRVASRGPRQVLQRALLRAGVIAEREFELVLPRLDALGATVAERAVTRAVGGVPTSLMGENRTLAARGRMQPVPETTRVSRRTEDAPNRREIADADRSFPGIPNPEGSRASPRRV